jgi:MYXO-CTERM domain-containing protein
MLLGRRMFLRGAAATVASAALPFVFQRPARADHFGPLVPDPAGVLDLPEGFSYRILEEAGALMDDGYVVPRLPDGMGCFEAPDGMLVLMRNHELTTSGGAHGSGAAAPAQAYRADSVGGVTRLIVDPETRERVSSNLVLTGTRRNCAGGLSPWGWLTCEESTDPEHGYVFLCPIDADSVREPQIIPGYGRYNHEAACVDPLTHIAYLTEDTGDSCLYRFVPNALDTPFEGNLQALKVVGARAYPLTAMSVGETRAVEWVPVPDPDPVTGSVRGQAQAAGAAILVRGEGIWFADGSVYVCSTSGGPIGRGQIFRLDPTADGGAITLLAQSTGTAVLDMPDNITVAPWGDVFMAEDGSAEQFVRVLDASGAVHDFARNALSGGELAGVCFSPDGRTLFVNLQVDGLTLAVWGPFPEGPPVTAADGGATQLDASVPDPDPDAGYADASRPDAGSGAVRSAGCGCSTPGPAPAAGPLAVTALATAALVARRD